MIFINNKEYITENYLKLDTQTIAEHLHITTGSVRRIAKELGITKRTKFDINNNDKEIKEIKEIPNFNKYLITEDGQIFRKHDLVLISHTVALDGYITVRLSDNDGKRRTQFVHRLLAICFILNPENFPEVNHIDGNKSNFSLDNLEWVSSSANQKHAYANNLRTPLVGNKNNRAKYTEDEIKNICALLEKHKSCTTVFKLLNEKYNIYLIKNIYRGLRWKHISKDYHFK